MYRHIRCDTNVPFYIGIGTKYKKRTRKGIYERAYIKGNRNNYWKNIVKKTNYVVEILFETTDIELIKEKEKEFISLYRDTLTNLTCGGFGIEGYAHTEESKKKIGIHSKSRKRKRGYKLNISEEGLKNIREFQKNRKVSKETRKKFSLNLKNNKRGLGHIKTKEVREKISKKLTQKIIQLDNFGNLVNIFYGYKSARESGFYKGGIYKSSKGLQGPYKGYNWKIIRESENG